MGNYILSPFKKSDDKNNHNNDLNAENEIKQNRRIILQNDKSIYSNLNDLTNFGNNYADSKKVKTNSKSNIYYHGYKHNKNKKNKKSKLLFEDAREGIIMNNIKRLSIMIFDKKKERENNNIINNTDINNKNIHYMKKYHNNDKFYQFGKKHKEEKKETLIDNKEIDYKKKENSKSKKNKSKSKSKNKSKEKNKDKNKIKKLEKNEKSSQFILLNNNNAFNTLKEINKENIVSNSNNIYQNENEIKFNNNNSNDDIDIDINIDKKEKNDSRNEEIIKDIDNIDNDIIFREKIDFENDLNDYINEEKEKDKVKNKEKDKEKNINFKETNDISEDINIESKLIDSSIYSYLGDSINNKKEGIGKLVYKNKIGLMSIFENDKIKINAPIIISDINGNSFKGYVDENNDLNGYFELKLNFNKIYLKKKYKYKNNFFIEQESKEKDDPIYIVINFTNLINNYLNLSTMKYNYYNIESEIYKNNINSYGIIKWKNNSKYIGEIKNNMKHGIGLFIWSDGSRYEGEFREDKIEGWGVIYFFDGKIFQGQISNGVPHGYGEFIWTNNNRYVGNYLNGQKEGFGIYIMNLENKNKLKNELVTYFGFWKNGKQDGYGIIIKNKKINYVKYKEGKKIRQYDYDIFIGKITKVINIKQKKLFFSDIKSLKKIIKSILQF